MRERQVSNAPKDPQSPPEESLEDFRKRLAAGLYGDLDLSDAEVDYMRASGLI
jgi:hypothetical protein